MRSVCTYFYDKLCFMYSGTISSLNNFKQIINENREFDELISQLFITFLQQRERSIQQSYRLPLRPVNQATITKGVRMYGPVTGKIHYIQKLFRRYVAFLKNYYREVCVTPKKKYVILGLGTATILAIDFLIGSTRTRIPIAPIKALSATSATHLVALVSQRLLDLALAVMAVSCLEFLRESTLRNPKVDVPFWNAMCEKVKGNTQVYFNHLPSLQKRINDQLIARFGPTSQIIKSFLPAVSFDCDVESYTGGPQRDAQRQFIISTLFDCANCAIVIGMPYVTKYFYGKTG